MARAVELLFTAKEWALAVARMDTLANENIHGSLALSAAAAVALSATATRLLARSHR